jgi:Uma2 family endonuclease
MSALQQPFYTPEEYLGIERRAEFKSEYYAGQMFAMAGASREHNLITGNVVGELRSLLRGQPCETYPSDMKVLVSATGLYTYPDVSVACGEPQFLDRQGDVLLNPLVIVEVLSDSTEAYDRGAKFALYQRIESLQEYVLVSQDKARVERYVRQPDGKWLYSRTDGLEDGVHLEAIHCRLPLSEVYARVRFAPPQGGFDQGAEG